MSSETPHPASHADDPNASGWRPIDSAPDDEEILVFTKSWGPIVALHNAEYGEWMSRMQVPVTIGEAEAPTHWQPLPPSPHGPDTPV